MRAFVRSSVRSCVRPSTSLAASTTSTSSSLFCWPFKLPPPQCAYPGLGSERGRRLFSSPPFLLSPIPSFLPPSLPTDCQKDPSYEPSIFPAQKAVKGAARPPVRPNHHSIVYTRILSVDITPYCTVLYSTYNYSSPSLMHMKGRPPLSLLPRNRGRSQTKTNGEAHDKMPFREEKTEKEKERRI